MNTMRYFWQTEKKNFTPGIVAVIAALALEFFAWGLTDSFYSTVVREIFHDLSLLGVLAGTFHLSAMIWTFFLLALLEKLHSKKILFWAKGGNILAMISYATGAKTGLLSLFFLGSVLNGLSTCSREIAMRDYLMEHCERQHASVIFGMNSALRDGSWAMALFLSGFLLVTLAHFFPGKIGDTYFLLLFFALPFMFLATGVLSRIPKEVPLKNTLPSPKHSHFAFFTVFSKMSLPVKFSILLMFFMQIIIVTTTLFLPLLAIEMHLPLQEVGLLMGFMSVPLFLSTVFCLFEDHFDRMIFIVGGLFFSTLPLFLLAQTQTPMMIAVLSMMTSLSIAIIRPATLGLIAAETTQEDAPLVASLQVFSNRLGAFFGAVVISLVAEQYGLQKAFFVVAVLATLFSVAAVFIKWRFRHFFLKQKTRSMVSHILHPLHFHHHER